MSRTERKELRLDGLTLLLYGLLVGFGLLNVYAASHKGAALTFDTNLLSTPYGKQLIFIGGSLLLGFVVLYTDPKFFEFFAYFLYGLGLMGVILVMLIGREVNGAQAWLSLGPFRLQPSEFMKVATCLAVARYMSDPGFSWKRTQDRLILGALIAVPALLILKQHDAGTALAFGSFIVVLYREGLSSLVVVLLLLMGLTAVLALVLNIVLVIGLIALFFLLVYYFVFDQKHATLHLGAAGGFGALALSTNLLIHNILEPHQRDRIIALFDPTFQPMGVNYATTQSKIAIGSGGLWGKGFLQGTQTKFDFVPQQNTDYIFCTIGEEYGWVGSTILLAVYLGFLAQLLYLSENARSNFARIYGYGVVGFLFVHLVVNIGMTIGFMPVIGIPLPFFSYGGSALLSFSVMVFILLNFYAQRVNILRSR